MYMEERKPLFNYFTKGEISLWCISVTLIVVSFLLFDRENYLTLVASFIGVTSLIFNAKGNPFGQFLMVIFSILYGAISFAFAYYGEMITYLGMTAPMVGAKLPQAEETKRRTEGTGKGAHEKHQRHLIQM